MAVEVLPDVYRDIVEIVTEAPGPSQAKQVAPRIGPPVVAGKIEGTRGRLKRLVERGRLREDVPGQCGLRQGLSRKQSRESTALVQTATMCTSLIA